MLLHIEKVQRRVWTGLKAPQGAAWSMHLRRYVPWKWNNHVAAAHALQLHASGHAEGAIN